MAPREPVNRWALRLAQPPANPSAGLPVGYPTVPRREEPAMNGGAEKWHPTVVSLLVLIVAETAVFAALRYVFRTAHGG